MKVSHPGEEYPCMMGVSGLVSLLRSGLTPGTFGFEGFVCSTVPVTSVESPVAFCKISVPFVSSCSRRPVVPSVSSSPKHEVVVYLDVGRATAV